MWFSAAGALLRAARKRSVLAVGKRVSVTVAFLSDYLHVTSNINGDSH